MDKKNNIPPVKDYMTAKQKNGVDLCAEDVYRDTYAWLDSCGCAGCVNVQLVNQYAMAVARQIQCEQALSELGFLAKSSTTGNVIASPYVDMLKQFTEQADFAWLRIYRVVRERTAGDIPAYIPGRETR